MENESRKLYSPNSAAQALDISRSKVYALMKTGTLGFVRVGADRRIPAAEVERIAAEGAPATTDQSSAKRGRPGRVAKPSAA